jgi:hypothetical protein
MTNLIEMPETRKSDAARDKKVRGENDKVIAALIDETRLPDPALFSSAGRAKQLAPPQVAVGPSAGGG